MRHLLFKQLLLNSPQFPDWSSGSPISRQIFAKRSQNNHLSIANRRRFYSFCVSQFLLIIKSISEQLMTNLVEKKGRNRRIICESCDHLSTKILRSFGKHLATNWRAWWSIGKLETAREQMATPANTAWGFVDKWQGPRIVAWISSISKFSGELSQKTEEVWRNMRTHGDTWGMFEEDLGDFKNLAFANVAKYCRAKPKGSICFLYK